MGRIQLFPCVKSHLAFPKKLRTKVPEYSIPWGHHLILIIKIRKMLLMSELSLFVIQSWNQKSLWEFLLAIGSKWLTQRPTTEQCPETERLRSTRPKWDVKPLPLQAQQSMRKRRWEDFKSQWWVTPRKQCLPDTTELIHSELTETVTTYTGPDRIQTRQSLNTEQKTWSPSPNQEGYL